MVDGIKDALVGINGLSNEQHERLTIIAVDRGVARNLYMGGQFEG